MEIAAVKLCEDIKTIAPAHEEDTTKKESTSPVPPKTVNPPVKRIEIKAEDGNFEPWGKILEELKNTKTLKSLYISLRDSSSYKSGNYILIDSKNSLAFELLRNNSEYRIAIKNIIKSITGRQYRLGPYKPENQEEISEKKPGKDPLDALIDKAQKNGINVTLN